MQIRTQLPASPKANHNLKEKYLILKAQTIKMFPQNATFYTLHFDVPLNNTDKTLLKNGTFWYYPYMRSISA